MSSVRAWVLEDILAAFPFGGLVHYWRLLAWSSGSALLRPWRHCQRAAPDA